MAKIASALKNASTSTSDSLINLFKGKRSANELLSDTAIIYSMKIGLCYLTEDNKPTFFNQVFGNEFTHSSVYFGLTLPDNKKTGVIVQYGKYAYIEPTTDNSNDIKNIGFPYGKDGGLMFGEMDSKTYQNEYCSVGDIPLILSKNYPKITLKKFLTEIKKKNGPWDLKSYDAYSKSCQDFVVSSLKVIKPGYNEGQIYISGNGTIPVVIKDELKNYEV